MEIRKADNSIAGYSNKINPKIETPKEAVDPDLEAVRDQIIASEKENIQPAKFKALLPAKEKDKSLPSQFADMKPYPSKTYLTVGEAFAQHKNRAEVLDHGSVVKQLPIDPKPSRHQLYIIKMDSGPEVKLAYNSDVGKPLPDMPQGEKLDMKGEYIYKPDGGVLHWTHKADGENHEDGYIIIERTGQKYD